MKFKFNVGDDVITLGHGHRGKISRMYNTCPQSNDWLSIQSIPVKAESIRKPWYSVACEPAGKVCVAESDLKRDINIFLIVENRISLN